MPGPINPKGSREPGENEWDVEILPDGSVKIATGPHSPAVHTDAAKLLAAIETDLGGKNVRRGDPRAHNHHNHGHHHRH